MWTGRNKRRLRNATAGKLSATVGAINNVGKASEEARIREVRAVMEKVKMVVCPAVVRHRAEFQAAAEKGKCVIEMGAKVKKAAEEIRALWEFLDDHAKRLAAAAKTKAKREAAKS